MRHHTKDKGDLGVLKAKCDLCEKGFVVLTPETEHAPFDLVIYKNGVFKTVQVKYRAAKKGSVTVVFRSYWSDSNGCHKKEVDKSLIDLYCIYCPDSAKCYYFDPKQHNKAITLRLDPSKNNQTEKINFADDFLRVP